MRPIGKKGDVTDMFVFLITVFILAIGLFVFAFTVPRISDGLNSAGLNSSSEGKTAINEMELIGTQLMQRGFLLLFAGIIISTMITSFLTRVHPVFLFLYILMLGLTIFLGIYLGNAYETLTENPTFAEMVESQSFINIIMSNILIISLAVGAMSMIIVFAKFSTIRGGSPL